MTWNKDQLFSSARQDWATPVPLFNAVNEEFCFSMDAAADASNTKCDLFLSESDDALGVSWANHLSNHGVDPATAAVWLNPPYGRGVGAWLQKVIAESCHIQSIVVLVMVRSDTKWWVDYAMRADEIRLIAGRVRFVGAASGAPAPSALLVFDHRLRHPRIKSVTLPRSE